MTITRWNPPTWLDRLGGIAWRFVAIVIALTMLVGGAIALSSIMVPVMLGLLFACALGPLARRLRRARVPNALGAVLCVLLLTAVIASAVWLTITTVVDHWGEIEQIVAQGRATLRKSATDAGIDPATSETVADSASKVVGGVVEPLLKGLVQLVPTVASIGLSLLLSIVLGFFFLKDGPSMWRWIVTHLGDSGRVLDHIGERAWSALSGFILGQTLIAAIDATGIAVGALVLGVPQPAAIFMLTFLGGYVPFVGAFLSGLVAVMLALGDSGLGTGVAMLAVVLAVQLLEGNVLQPWIQGRAVRLHPVVIALAVTAGGAVAGFLGVLLAVPVTAIAVVALSELRAAGLVGPRAHATARVADDLP